MRRLPPGQAARGEELLRRADVEGAGRVQAKGLVRAGGPGRLARGQGKGRPVRGLHVSFARKIGPPARHRPTAARSAPSARSQTRRRRRARSGCCPRAAGAARGPPSHNSGSTGRPCGAADKGFAVYVQAIAVRGGYAQLGPLHRPLQAELQAEERGLGLVAPPRRPAATRAHFAPARSRSISISTANDLLFSDGRRFFSSAWTGPPARSGGPAQTSSRPRARPGGGSIPPRPRRRDRSSSPPAA